MHPTARRRIAETSLFFFGEIGVNDYFLALASNHTVEQAAATLVPDIVGVIRSAVIVRLKHTLLPNLHPKIAGNRQLTIYLIARRTPSSPEQERWWSPG